MWSLTCGTWEVVKLLKGKYIVARSLAVLRLVFKGAVRTVDPCFVFQLSSSY